MSPNAREDLTLFERVVGLKNISSILTEQKIEETKANEGDIEALAWVFENTSTWADITQQFDQNFTKAEEKMGVQVLMKSKCHETKGNKLWDFKKCKGPHTCVNPMMNRDPLTRSLVRAELYISVATIHAAVA